MWKTFRTTKNARAVILLIILCAVGALLGYQRYDEARQRELAVERYNEHMKIAKQIKESATARPNNDVEMSKPTIGRNFTKPVSHWQTREKAYYADLLAHQKYDVLVVPFQVQDFAFDQPSREIMSGQLAETIAEVAQVTVPDTFTVERALGDGNRRFEPDDIYKLASQLQVKRIVFAYVGHDNGQLALTIEVQDGDKQTGINAASAKRSWTFDKIDFNDENPGVVAVQALLPQVLADLGYSKADLRIDTDVVSADMDTLPASPKDMMQAEQNHAMSALAYEVLSALTPQQETHTAWRMAAKAWLSASRLADAAPQKHLLLARAAYQLGMRPYALHLLGTPQSTEELELTAALNGNLPNVKQETAKLHGGYSKLLGAADQNSIEFNYRALNQKQARDRVRQLSLPGKGWPFLVERAFTDRFEWEQSSNLTLKTLLDFEFTIPGNSADELLRSGQLSMQADQLDQRIDLSVHKHVRRYLSEKIVGQDSTESQRTQLTDYLDLLDAIGTDNLMRGVNFEAVVQGRPEEALQMLELISSTYLDHPRFAWERSVAGAKAAENLQGPDKDALAKQAYLDAVNAFYWEQGQTLVANDAFRYAGQVPHMSFVIFNIYGSDVPFRPYYIQSLSIVNTGVTQQEIARAALANSTDDVTPIYVELNSTPPNERPQTVESLRSQLNNRFAGNTWSADLAAAFSTDPVVIEQQLRKSIAAQPTDWNGYLQLGTMLAESGATRKAFDVFMSYPGFKSKSDENRVGIANCAYEAGRMFYYSGNFAEAVPLLKIAANSNTGAETELVSNQFLSLINGNLDGLLQNLRERIDHYHAKNAIQTYQMLLQSSGLTMQGWAMADTLSHQHNNVLIWPGALSGFRMSNASEQDMFNWAQAHDGKASPDDEAENPALFLLLGELMDRTPSAQAPGYIDALELPILMTQLKPPVGQVLHPVDKNAPVMMARRNADKSATILGTGSHQGFSLTVNGLALPKDAQRSRSHRSYFAEAYRSIKLGDYDAANKTFGEIVGHYDMLSEPTRFMLPYWAIVSVRSKSVDAIEKQLDSVSPTYRRSSYYLARAVLLAAHGDINKSLELLRSARTRCTDEHTDGLPPDYVYAETVEWLYQETKRTEFRNEVLDWSVKNQVIHPWLAWPYAMEAEFQTDTVRRAQAIAMASYLDAGSARIAALPESVRKSAKLSKKGNPFSALNETMQAIAINVPDAT